jgi:RNA polymerase sigma-70 factor (ECF subfamily)
MGAAAESEREMVSQLQRGEAAAIESLYDRYGRLAYSLAYRMLNDVGASEDVVQEAFLSLWQNAPTFDAARGSLRAWLLSMVHNRAIDRLRGTKRHRGLAPLEEADRTADVPDAWETVSLDIERKQVREALSSLPADQQRTLQLAYYGGLSQTEIARQLEVPLGTVKGRTRLGLEKLRSFLQARGLEP